MLHSEQKCAYFCSKWSIVGYGRGAFWDLWNWSIDAATGTGSRYQSIEYMVAIGVLILDKVLSKVGQ